MPESPIRRIHFPDGLHRCFLRLNPWARPDALSRGIEQSYVVALSLIDKQLFTIGLGWMPRAAELRNDDWLSPGHHSR